MNTDWISIVIVLVVFVLGYQLGSYMQNHKRS